MPIGTYTPPPPLAKALHNFFSSNFYIFFFHFRCILLQISHQKCFFISISIPGRSGVNYNNNFFIRTEYYFDSTTILIIIIIIIIFYFRQWSI